MWLIIPLVYFLGWWQTGSLRQAFNATVAWIVGFSVAAAALLFLDIGGFSGITATPDSPAAGLAFLGGFIGFWISNIIWRRRGGDPERQPGKWERTIRATLGMDEKSKKKKRKKRAANKPAVQPQYQASPPSLQQPAGAMPVDASYRPAPQQQSQSAPPQQQVYSASPVAPAKKNQQRNDTTADKYAKATGRALGAMFRSSESKRPATSQPSPQQQPAAPPRQANSTASPTEQPYTPAPPPKPKKKQQRRNSPTADKYAKATGRALGAMFRSPDKKKSKNSPKR